MAKRLVHTWISLVYIVKSLSLRLSCHFLFEILVRVIGSGGYVLFESGFGMIGTAVILFFDGLRLWFRKELNSLLLYRVS